MPMLPKFKAQVPFKRYALLWMALFASSAAFAEPINLAELEEDYVAQSGDTLTDTLSSAYMLSIADGAEVVLTGSLADLSEGEDHVLLEAKGGIVAQGDVIMPEVPEKWQIRVRSNKITLGPKRGMILTIR